MKPKTLKAEPELLIFSKEIKMKFAPKKETVVPVEISQEPPRTSFFQKLTSMLPWKNSRSLNVTSESNVGQVSQQNVQEEGGDKQNTDLTGRRLIFLESLNANTILVGNNNQLDAISFGIINSEGFTQTQYLWSLSHSQGIDALALDNKKKQTFVLLSNNKLFFYKYKNKNTQEKPEHHATVPLSSKPRFVYIVRQYVACFFQTKVQLFLVNDGRRKYCKSFLDIQRFKNQGYALYTVPPHKDNTFNIFFERKKEDSDLYIIEEAELQILQSDIKLSKMSVVYEIKESIKRRLNIFSYSKGTFIMNLQSEVLAVKKGYILDSAQMDKSNEQTKFIYMPFNSNLLHVGIDKVEVYSFSLNQSTKPYRIVSQSKDSLKFPDRSKGQLIDDQYFSTIELNNGFVMIYQENPKLNKKTKGQIEYTIYLTRPISRKKKIDEIFPKQNAGQHLKEVDLFDKCNMAQKMGLTKKQIYLQLWKRSTKRTENDFNLLLCTKDYTTIKNQLKNKLKKHSMKLKQLYKIQQNIFFMLQEEILKPKCQRQRIVEYGRIHYFKRKLQYLKDLHVVEKMEGQVGEASVVTISIHQYYEYESMNVLNQLLSFVKAFSETKKAIYVKKIRLLVKHFRFVFRFHYFEVLKQLIATAKEGLLPLIKQMRQLLPYVYPVEEQPNDYWQGVYRDIDKRQWNQSLYAENVFTIDTRDMYYEEIVKAVQFRRNWLTYHDSISQSRQTIVNRYKEIKSSKIFYHFLSNALQQIKDKAVAKELIEFLEKTYEDLPKHLRGRIQLYYVVYKFLQEKSLLPKEDNQPYSVSKFLQLQDYQLYKHFFDLERDKKKLILNKLKPQCFEILENGDTMFSQMLLSYFISDVSEVSDLKYILNRINNEKIEFHQKNQELYEILVESLKRKMKVGSKNDVPLTQVLIYVDSIPLKTLGAGEVHPAIAELKIISKIEKQADLMKKAQINMTLYDIMNSQEELLSKLIEYKIKENRLLELTGEENFQIFDKTAYEIMANLQHLSEGIYQDLHSMTIFFLFIIQICQKKSLIKNAKRLLNDSNLTPCYDEQTPDNVVQFMYKWKISDVKKYMQCQSYIRELLTLLPQDHETAVYILNQLQLALYLSDIKHQQTYPLTKNIINCYDLQEIIEELPADFVKNFSAEKLLNYTKNIQNIVFKQMQQQNEQASFIGITKHDILKIIIVKMLQTGKLKESIPFMRQLFECQVPNKNENILYPILLLVEISSELSDQNISAFLEIVSRYFHDPSGLLDILQNLVSNPLNTFQRKEFLQIKQQQSKNKYIGYNENNGLFNQQLLNTVKRKGYEKNFFVALIRTIKHLQSSKQQFNKIKFSVFTIILYNDPYLATEFFNLNRYINMKSLRSFLSYILQQNVFDPLAVLEFGRRVFLAVCQSRFEREQLCHIIDNYKSAPLNEFAQINFGFEKSKQDNFENRLWKSAQAFKKKRISLCKNKSKKLKELQEKSNEMMQQITVVQNIGDQAPSDYPFSDSDNQYGHEDIFEDTKGKKEKLNIDINQQKAKALKKYKKQEGKGRNLYHTTEIKPKKGSLKPTFSIEKRVAVPTKIQRETSFKFDMNEMADSQIPEKQEEQYQIYVSGVGGDKKAEIQETPKQESIKQEESLSEIKNKLIVQNLQVLESREHTYDFSALKSMSNESSSLMDIAKNVYQQPPSSVPKEELVYLLIAMKEEFQSLALKSQILDIYRKAYSLEAKHKLDLPIYDIFTFAALSQAQDSQKLFKVVLPSIMSLLDDVNIFKVSKAMALIFGLGSFQQQIVFEFLCSKMKEKPKARGAQLNQFYQKIEGLAEKVDTMTLIKKLGDLLNQVQTPADKERLKKIVGKVVEKNGSPYEKTAYTQELKELSRKK